MLVILKNKASPFKIFDFYCMANGFVATSDQTLGLSYKLVLSSYKQKLSSR